MSKRAVCHLCGANPCYLICPMADPHGGDQFAEHQAHEAGAGFSSSDLRSEGEDWVTASDEVRAIEAIEAQEKDSTAPTGWEDTDDLPADEDPIPF